MSQEQYANHGGTTLSAAMDATQTSLPITSATGLPGRPQYRVRVDDEIMLVTGGAGTTTQTVTRGVEGTTAATHNNGVAVNHVLTQESLQQLLAPRYSGGIGIASRGRNSVYVQEDFLTGGSGGGQFGTLGWAAFNVSTITALASEANRPGIMRFISPATNPSTTALALRAFATAGVVLTDVFDLMFIFRYQLNGGVNTATLLRLGMSTDPSTTGDPAGAIHLEKLAADTTWFAVTRSAGGTPTRTDTNVSAAANAWVKVRIRREIAAGPVIFNVNDGADISHTTAIPTVALMPGATIRTTEAIAKHLDIDYFDLYLAGFNR